MKNYIDNNRPPAGEEERIVYISPKKLIPYEKNPRMNDGGVQPLIESIKAYGFKVPIVVDGNNVVICGHTRLKAALQMGLDSVPCIIADDLSEEQVKAFRIADNKVSDFSIWDNKLLLGELDEITDGLFTGFDLGGIFDDTLDENYNKPVEENEDGVTYEIVVRSSDRKKIERLQALWEQVQNE